MWYKYLVMPIYNNVVRPEIVKLVDDPDTDWDDRFIQLLDKLVALLTERL